MLSTFRRREIIKIPTTKSRMCYFLFNFVLISLCGFPQPIPAVMGLTLRDRQLFMLAFTTMTNFEQSIKKNTHARLIGKKMERTHGGIERKCKLQCPYCPL